MKEVADGLGVPWYVFSASGAAFLCSMFYLQALHDDQGVNLTEFKNSDALLEIPGLANPLPAKLAPSMSSNPMRFTLFPMVVRTLLCIPVGPMVKHGGDGRDLRSDESDSNRDIMEWLDDQPPLSVMFLCFGSWGSFSGAQVKEIARALEHCGHRFLWSLRKPSSQKDRTVEIGKVIGWAPQVEILAHPAVGGFASHCGWNSILESVRFGVPVATWPLYAEQQLNAFQMVIDLGLAVEIKIDYWRDFLGDNEIIVSGDDIEKAIKHVMEEDSEVRKKVKEMSRIRPKVR
ncbi:hypothetical protein OIU84_011838 [Salix udensis]|uniref:anthocyanidin 3-O-glucosyltransferase n=1 Tax=Salix udensis TaxID=889485 RepID=A0AAD6JNT6_9ROSI|nr:hypothetical protein OIU84_011838 [Salix udensis]